ncbi:hypothetical protein FB461_2284 [Rarobacter faecitabidus]|uniref:Alpha-L-rhamnosidase six-hairpin glycosidase domain-containing protein n=1 Tax=Rarobacter faecitabidus TaxID=13243 RepID=A0A542ZA00_RARFA|nr:hypothetical protein FB461_2284 [Rarobacter faecitabidus]
MLSKRVVALAISLVLPLGAGLALAAPASGWTGIPGGDLSAGRTGIGQLAQVIDATYGSLSDRVRPSGYAPTSVNGGYGGMFVRDSAIQAMAMQSAGEEDKSRAVLQYIASYGGVRGLERAPRYLPDEKYETRATIPYAQGNPQTPILQYTTTSDALFKVNAPGNAAAQSFVASDDTITRAEFALLNKGATTATVTVDLRSDYAKENSSIARIQASVPTSGTTPTWVSFDFGDQPELVIGRTYYLVIQATTAAGDVQYWGTVGGAGNDTRAYNYDGYWRTGPDRGAFRLYAPVGGQVGPEQSQGDADGSAFRVSAGNKVAQPFKLQDSTLASVAVRAWADAGETGTARVTVRASRDGSEIAHGVIDGATLPIQSAAQWISVPLTVDQPSAVTTGQNYVLQIESTNSTERIAVDGSHTVASPPGAMWNYENSSWSQSDRTLAFAVNSSGAPGAAADPTQVVARVGGDTQITQQLTVGSPLTGFELFLGAGSGTSGEVVATISDDAGWTRTATIATSALPATGSWQRIEFPTVGVTGDNHYRLTLAAPQSATDSIAVYGVPDATGGVADSLNQAAGTAEATALDAAIALRALSLSYSGESMENQTDGHYMYLLAWARYINAFPGDTSFIDETYPIVSAWADYYLTDEYWNDSTNPKTGKQMNLLFNPLLEHSRSQQHFPAYDLITNVFASQALHELAEVARLVPGQEVAAQDWQEWSEKITQGINDNLVVERTVNGQVKKIYRELYAVAGGASPAKSGALSAYDGFTWVNLAPIAADWSDIDLNIMANTYEAYLETGSYDWPKPGGGYWKMLNACSSAGPDAGGTCNDVAEVIGKGLGWEFALVKRVGGQVLADRLPVLTDFVIAKTPGLLLQESFYPDGRPKDAGNQEQTSWWIWGALQAYPRAAIAGSTPTISGVTAVAQALTADAGAWSPQNAQLSYQWFAEGAAIYGATSPTFTIPASLVGKRLSVRVVGALAGYDHATKESAATEPVSSQAVASSVPTIAGDAKVGAALSVNPGTWGEGATLSYQWFADGAAIAGQDGVTLALGQDLLGRVITVTVTGTKSGYATVIRESSPTQAVRAADPGRPTPIITAGTAKVQGSARVGDRVSVDAGLWRPAGVSLSYQWLANGSVVAGATSSSLTVPTGVVGKRLSVRVTGTLAGATTVSVTSAATSPVAKGKLVGKKPKVTGKAKVGKKLKATVKAWGPGKVTLSYRWYANGKRIKGATKKTLVVKKKWRGKKVTVRVTGKKPGYTTATAKSTAKKIRK